MSVFNSLTYLLTTNNDSLMPDDDLPEVVVIGRSNVGKSTFINTISRNEKLSKISSKPGKTKVASFFQYKNFFRLVDLPGYGYANVSKEEKRNMDLFIRNFLKNRKNIDKIIILLDIRRGITDIDYQFILSLMKLKLNFTIIGTKLDKCKQREISNFNKEINYTFHIQPILYSAKSKKGLKNVISIFDEYI